jgi:hypothetical protein
MRGMLQPDELLSSFFDFSPPVKIKSGGFESFSSDTRKHFTAKNAVLNAVNIE